MAQDDKMLVPVEPTREMWAAGANAVIGYKQRHHDKVVADVWSAMLSAAPAQPATVEGAEWLTDEDHAVIKRCVERQPKLYMRGQHEGYYVHSDIADLIDMIGRAQPAALDEGAAGEPGAWRYRFLGNSETDAAAWAEGHWAVTIHPRSSCALYEVQPLYAHPSPTSAADADRGMKAFNFINDLYRIKAEFPAISLRGALKKAEALAALKSTAAKEGDAPQGDAASDAG